MHHDRRSKITRCLLFEVPAVSGLVHPKLIVRIAPC